MRPTIQGHLAGQPLPELLQYLHMLRKTGQLVIERSEPPAAASIYIKQGRIVHACCPPVEGIDAIYAILPWRDGRFLFLDGTVPEQETIAVELHSILLECARRSDELQRLYVQLPSVDTVLYPEFDREVTPDARLTRGQWRMLGRVDGSRTVHDLIQSAGADELTAVSDLTALFAHSLVRTAPREAFLAGIVPEALVTVDEIADAEYLTGLELSLLGLMDGRRSLADLSLATGADGISVAVSCRRLIEYELARIVTGLAAYHRYLL